MKEEQQLEDTTKSRRRDRNWKKERILNTYIVHTVQTVSFYNFSLKVTSHTLPRLSQLRWNKWVLTEVSYSDPNTEL
jgi:hypothetical protein